MVAHTAEAGHRGNPSAGQRGQVNTVAGVVIEVAEVQEGGFAEVAVRQLEVADLGCDHRLDLGDSEKSPTVSAS